MIMKILGMNQKTSPFRILFWVSFGLAQSVSSFAYDINWRMSQPPHWALCGTTLVSVVCRCGYLGWEDSYKLGNLSRSELKKWMGLHQSDRSTALQVVGDFVRPGELPAIFDLIHFQRGEWGEYEPLQAHLEPQRLTREVWDRHLESARRAVVSGVDSETRRNLYVFLSVVKQGRAARNGELARADFVGGGSSLLSLFSCVIRSADVDPEANALAALARAGIHQAAGLRHRNNAAVLEASVALLAHAWIAPEAGPVGGQAQAQGLRALIDAVRQFFQDGGPAVQGAGRALVVGDYLPLVQVEENLLAADPLWRDLYTQGPGAELISTAAFRRFVVEHPELLSGRTALDYFADPVNRQTLRGLPNEEARQQRILQDLLPEEIEVEGSARV
jgi:hypothetical protein